MNQRHASHGYVEALSACGNALYPITGARAVGSSEQLCTRAHGERREQMHTQTVDRTPVRTRASAAIGTAASPKLVQGCASIRA